MAFKKANEGEEWRMKVLGRKTTSGMKRRECPPKMTYGVDQIEAERQK